MSAELEGFVDYLLECVGRSQRLLVALIEEWLRHFQPAARHFRRAGRRIATLLAQGKTATGRTAFWQRAARDHALFDAEGGPSRLAAEVLERGDLTPLEDCGLTSPMRAVSAFMRATQAAFLHSLAVRLPKADGQMLELTENFLAPDGQLRFQDNAAQGELADALVQPWASGCDAPSEVLREWVLKFLTQHLGDPRVDSANWACTSENTRTVLRGWLTRVAIDAFFRKIGQFAERAGYDETWKAREAFWRMCLDQRIIADGWLVLGSEVRADVGHTKELRGAYGELHGAGSNQSVLLMRIGPIVFAEWSHNGALRAWPGGSLHAPRFYHAGTYDAHRLKTGELRFPPPRYRPDLGPTNEMSLTHHKQIWQGRVAALLLSHRIGLPAWITGPEEQR
jgi:hypothetical protein